MIIVIMFHNVFDWIGLNWIGLNDVTHTDAFNLSFVYDFAQLNLVGESESIGGV